MEEEKNNPIKASVIAATTALTVILWLLHLLPFLFPDARLWGFNHLLFLPGSLSYIYLIAGIFALVLLLPAGARARNRLFEKAAAALLEKRYRLRWAFFAATSAVIFWIFRLPIFLLGDSYSIIENIGNELPVIFKWSEIGAIYLAYFVSRLMPVTGSELGEYAYGIIAVISGGFTVYLYFALAYELGRDSVGRLLIFCLSIFAGWIVLFLGYTENYPVLWPFMTGYIYFGIRYINRKGTLLWPTLMVVLALILHLQTLFFLLSYPVLLVARGKAARLYRTYRKFIWPALIGAAIVAVIIFVRQFRNSLELQLYIIPLIKGRPATPGYSLLSLSHLTDIANQLLLLTPLLPALIVLGWRGWRSLIKNKIDLFLLLLTAGGIAFLFIIDPKLGFGRDWDLFALAGLPPLLLFTKNAVDGRSTRAGLYPALVLISMVMIMPFVATNLSRQPAIDNYKYLLNLDLPKSRTGITILRQVAKAQNDSILMDSLKNVLVENFPAVHQAPRAFELAEQGKFAEAMILADSMALFDPHSVEVYNLRGIINLKQGRYAQAVQDLEKAADLGRYDARPLASLASAYSHLGQTERMMDALRKGQRRNPHLFEILDGLMTAFHTTRQFDSALVYAQILMQVRPAYSRSYYAAGYAAMNMGDKARAEIYLTRFLEMESEGPLRTRAEELLQEIQ